MLSMLPCDCRALKETSGQPAGHLKALDCVGVLGPHMRAYSARHAQTCHSEARAHTTGHIGEDGNTAHVA